jgi:dihydrofolate reductase
MARKLTLYIATSTDGFIATPDGDLSFLNVVETPGEDYGYHQFMASVDTVMLGRKTYDKIVSLGVENPHSDKECYVITRTPREGKGNLTFYSGEITELVTRLKNEPGNRIFCDGGSEIIDLLLRHELIDEFIISVIPTLLGNGIPLFKAGRNLLPLKLLSSQAYPSGLLQMHYEVKK